MADVLISMNRFASDYTNEFLYLGMTFDKSNVVSKASPLDIEDGADIIDIENFI